MRYGARKLSHGRDTADVGEVGLRRAQGLSCPPCSGDEARDEEREGDEGNQRDPVGRPAEDRKLPELRGKDVREAQEREDEDQQRRNETTQSDVKTTADT